MKNSLKDRAFFILLKPPIRVFDRSNVMKPMNRKKAVLMLFIAGVSVTAGAQTPTDPRDASCVEVEVNGQRAPAYGCLQQQMAPPTAPAGKDRKTDPALDSADVTRLPPNQTGQFSQSALRNRMGNALGNGVKPQRPPRNE